MVVTYSATNPNFSEPAYRRDIDGLRAVAVLLVVLNHYFPHVVKSGFIGVDIFFVISGLLISTIIFSSLESNSFTILGFYNRRIRRIFPALLLVMVASLVFGWFALFADEFSYLGKHVAGGATFISNFLLSGESGYFDSDSASKPLKHLWSLSIEEQFYLFWPLLLILCSKRKASFLSVTAVIGLLSFGCNLLMVGQWPSAAYYWPLSRVWELMAGGVLAYIQLHCPQLLQHGKQLQAWAGALMICIAAALLNEQSAFPGWWALLPVFGTFLIISAGGQAWPNRWILSSKVAVFIGLISYPLYLWHWLLLSFARIVMGIELDRSLRVSLIAASLVLSWLTYRLVERPIRRKKGTGTALCLLGLMIVVGAAGLTIKLHDGYESRSFIQSSSLKGEVANQFAIRGWKYTYNANCTKRFPYNGQFSMGWWFCMLERDAPPTVIILGNSFANQLYPGLVEQSDLSQQNFLSVGACDPALAPNPRWNLLLVTNPCVGTRLIEEQNFLDRIIESNHSLRYAILAGLSDTPDSGYIQRLKSRVDYLEAHGIRVFIVVPHLKVDYDIRSCFSRPLAPASRQCKEPVSMREQLNARFQPLIDSFHRTNPEVLIFDPNGLFCNAGSCSFIRDGLPLYRDQFQHVSEYGSGIIANDFAAYLRTNLPEALNRGQR